MITYSFKSMGDFSVYQCNSLPNLGRIKILNPWKSHHNMRSTMQRHCSRRHLGAHAFLWGVHRWPVHSAYKWPVTRKMFPFDDVIMKFTYMSMCSSGVSDNVESHLVQPWAIMRNVHLWPTHHHIISSIVLIWHHGWSFFKLETHLQLELLPHKTLNLHI